MLRLPGSVAPYFTERLQADLPLKAQKIISRIREARGGKLNSAEFGERMGGRGPHWEMTVKTFQLHCKRLGFNVERVVAGQRKHTFRRPSAQPGLFD
jgi:DNA repair photolyase